MNEIVVTKRGISAFANSDLDVILRSLGISKVVLAGVATRFVVEGTARDTFEHGYRYIVLEDCCASSSPAMHEAAIAFMATLAKSVRQRFGYNRSAGADQANDCVPGGDDPRPVILSFQ